jgi:hypothetical protein
MAIAVEGVVDTCITLRLLEIRTNPTSVMGVVAQPLEDERENQCRAAA